MSGTRVPAIAGIVFAITFFAGFLILGETFGNFGDSDGTFEEYYQEDHAPEIIGGYLLAVAAVAFVVFVAGICAPVLSEARRQSRAIIGMACAAVFAALLGVAGAAAITIPLSRFFGGDVFSDGEQLVSEVAAVPQLAYVVLVVPGALFASAAVFSASLVMRDDASFPRWITTAGLVAAALLLLALFFMPLFVLPLWVLAAAIALLRHDQASE